MAKYNFNQIIFEGNVTKDPESRFTPDGKQVSNFTVGVNYGDTVTWYRVTAWQKTAEACNTYLKKGAAVLVQGRLTPDSNGNPRVWEGTDGVSHASFEVTAQVVRFLSGKGEQATERDDEVPF